MTRPVVQGGLPGPGQTIFPEEAMEQGRFIGLTDTCTILRNNGEKKGGVQKDKWEPVEENVRCRIDIAPFGGPRGEIADQINEETTHIAHLDPDADVQASDRIEMNDLRLAVLTVYTRTDQPTIALEAKSI